VFLLILYDLSYKKKVKILLTTIITPRVSETDGVGHINNVFVPIWFEAGRREIFKIFSPDLSFKTWKLALVNINIDYKDQLFLSHEVYIKTWIEKIGNSSFQIGEKIEQTGRICVEGQATYVNYNFNTKMAELLTADKRSALKNFILKN